MDFAFTVDLASSNSGMQPTNHMLPNLAGTTSTAATITTTAAATTTTTNSPAALSTPQSPTTTQETAPTGASGKK